MNGWTLEAWRGVVEAAPEGIVICDATAADCPVVFVNAAFSRMCGYPAAALLGNNLRMLQAADREQEPGPLAVAAAVRESDSMPPPARDGGRRCEYWHFPGCDGVP